METSSPTTGSSREVRRRRIVERGSDRLALITGRIQSLPPDPDQSPPATRLPPSVSPLHENKDSGSLSADIDSSSELRQQNDNGPGVEPPMLKHEVDRITEISSAAVLGSEEHPARVSSAIQTPVTNSRQRSYHNLFTASRISSAISASENTRICFSVAAAILVILSYMGFPIRSWSMVRSSVFFRPLFLLLLTNMSIVVARLLLGKGGVERTGQINVPSTGGDGLVDQVGKALESGLLLQSIVGALFMDCSLYAVVLISGLPLARRLGW